MTIGLKVAGRLKCKLLLMPKLPTLGSWSCHLARSFAFSLSTSTVYVLHSNDHVERIYSFSGKAFRVGHVASEDFGGHPKPFSDGLVPHPALGAATKVPVKSHSLESLPPHARYDYGFAPPTIQGRMEAEEEAPSAEEAQSSVKKKTWADLLEDEQGTNATAGAPPASTPKASPSAPAPEVKPEVEQSTAAKAEPSVDVGPTPMEVEPPLDQDPSALSSQTSEYISSAAQFIGSGTHEVESDFAVPHTPPPAEDDGIGAFIDKPLYPARVPPEPRDMTPDEI